MSDDDIHKLDNGLLVSYLCEVYHDQKRSTECMNMEQAAKAAEYRQRLETELIDRLNKTN